MKKSSVYNEINDFFAKIPLLLDKIQKASEIEEKKKQAKDKLKKHFF